MAEASRRVCPQCRASLPAGAVPPNFALIDFIGQLRPRGAQGLPQAGDSVPAPAAAAGAQPLAGEVMRPASACNGNNGVKCEGCALANATIYCIDCQTHPSLCQGCFEKGHAVPWLKSHNKMLLADKKFEHPFCETHTDQRLTPFCTNCDLLVCVSCESGDQPHRSHNVTSLTQAVSTRRSSVRARHKEAVQRAEILTTRSGELSDLFAGGTFVHARVLEQVDAAHAELVASLHDRWQIVRADADRYYSKELPTAMLDALGDIKRQADAFQACSTVLAPLCDEKSTSNLKLMRQSGDYHDSVAKYEAARSLRIRGVSTDLSDSTGDTKALAVFPVAWRHPLREVVRSPNAPHQLAQLLALQQPDRNGGLIAVVPAAAAASASSAAGGGVARPAAAVLSMSVESTESHFTRFMRYILRMLRMLRARSPLVLHDNILVNAHDVAQSFLTANGRADERHDMGEFRAYCFFAVRMLLHYASMMPLERRSDLLVYANRATWDALPARWSAVSELYRTNGQSAYAPPIPDAKDPDAVLAGMMWQYKLKREARRTDAAAPLAASAAVPFAAAAADAAAAAPASAARAMALAGPAAAGAGTAAAQLQFRFEDRYDGTAGRVRPGRVVDVCAAWLKDARAPYNEAMVLTVRPLSNAPENSQVLVRLLGFDGADAEAWVRMSAIFEFRKRSLPRAGLPPGKGGHTAYERQLLARAVSRGETGWRVTPQTDDWWFQPEFRSIQWLDAGRRLEAERRAQR